MPYSAASYCTTKEAHQNKNSYQDVANKECLSNILSRGMRFEYFTRYLCVTVSLGRLGEILSISIFKVFWHTVSVS